MERKLARLWIIVVFLSCMYVMVGCTNNQIINRSDAMDRNAIFEYVTQHEKQLEQLILRLNQYETNIQFSVIEGEISVRVKDQNIMEVLSSDTELLKIVRELLENYPMVKIVKRKFQTQDDFIYYIDFPVYSSGKVPNVIYSETDKKEGEVIVGNWRYKELYGV